MNIQFNTNTLGKGFKARRQKFGLGSLIILLLVGLAFTVVGYIAIKGTKIDSSWQRTTGQIVDSSSYISNGSTMYTAVVKYTADGQEQQITSSMSSSIAPTLGESKEVAYNPMQPNNAKVIEDAGATWWLWLFPVIGITLLIITPVAYIRSLRRSTNIAKLVQNGQKLQGVLVDIQSSSSKNSSSYKVVVSASDNIGNVQNYVSDYINGIGGLAMADFRNSPIPIDVYIDPVNPKNYYVDISDIPNLTPQRISELIQKAVPNNNQPQSFMDTNKEQTPGPPTSNITQPPVAQ